MAGDFFGLSGHVIEGQFHAIEIAGEGGFSVVYRGQHLALREPVAIKCLKFKHKDPAVIASFTQRFFDESRIMYRLSQGNLNIVRAITTGVTVAPATGVSVPYMVLEWLEGESLSMMLKVRRAAKGPGLTLEEAITMFEPAALAVAYAHSQGVVHRDIKPGNLFMQKTTSGTTMKVLDFGMAKVVTPEAMGGIESAETLGGVMVLSPQYVTPEQLDKTYGPIGPWTDVYAFTLILIEALTGKRARVADSFADLLLHITKGEAALRQRGLTVNDAVERVFERALARDTNERYPELGSFWRELKEAASKTQTYDIDGDTSVDVSAQIRDLGGTVVMSGLRPSRPSDMGKTMPLSSLPRAPSVSSAPGPTSLAGTLLMRAPAPEIPPIVSPIPDPPPQVEPEPEPPSPPPPRSTRPRGRPVLVFFLVLFVALSLGASGLLFVKMLRS